MGAAGGVALVPTEVWAASTANVLGWAGGVSHHLVTALPQDPELLASFTSWTQLEMGVHNVGLCILTGQGAALPCWYCGPSGWELWVTTWVSASHRAQSCLHLFRVIHQFWKCDELCEQTLCNRKKLLLSSAPLTFHHGCKVKINSKVKIMSDRYSV